MERKSYIGGSDIGCILGLSTYKSALDIYNEKTSEKVSDETMSEAAYWGTMLEDSVAKEYAKRTGFRVEKPAGLIRHPEHKFLAANIDRWVVDDNSQSGTFVLECKTAGTHRAKEWGEDENEIPQLYKCQVAFYSAICNVPKVDIAVLIGGQEFRIYTYRKDEIFENKLIRAGYIFWNNYVAKNIAPSASSLADVTSLYPKSNGSAIKADDQVVANIEELRVIKSQEKALTQSKEILEMNIKSYIGSNEILVNEDEEILATWRNGKERRVLDTGRLQEEHESIYKQYLVEKEGSRTFLIK